MNIGKDFLSTGWFAVSSCRVTAPPCRVTATTMRKPKSRPARTRKPAGRSRGAGARKPRTRTQRTPVAKVAERPQKEQIGEDPVVAGILDALASAESLSPRDVARHIAGARARPGDGPGLWRRYFMAVKQRAVNLAREGRIEIVRKGQVVDPEDFKGIVRYRLPGTN